MYRNQYDTDVTTFSPAGRIHQVEYASEAVKQGSCCVGLKSRDVVVIAAVQRQLSEFSSYQQKIFKVDDHAGIASSGLISDARVLRKYMTLECLSHRHNFGTPQPIGRLVRKVSDKAQNLTQQSSGRPYGVGLLVASYEDDTGTHLYQTDPSGNYFEFIAQAMGARSQSAKTYLEKHYESFDEMKLDDLVVHALTALKGALQKEKMTAQNVGIAFVGNNMPFTLLDEDAIRPYVELATAGDDDEKVDDVEIADAKQPDE